MNPCGVARDFVRSCYRAVMVFGEGPAAIRVPIRWWFTSKKNDHTPTIYTSRNWFEPKSQTSKGAEERHFFEDWRDGSGPGPLNCSGPQGSPAAWAGDNSGPWFAVRGFDGRGGLRFGGKGKFTSKGVGGVKLDGRGLAVTVGAGGLVLNGTGEFVERDVGGLVLDGSGKYLLRGSGGLVLDGAGEFIEEDRGGLVLDGRGLVINIGSGGMVLDGRGAFFLRGSGGLVLDGSGHFPLVGAGGLVLDGSGVAVNVSSGGLVLDGTGARPVVGSGGLVLDGSGKFALVGSGGVRIDGAGLFALRGSGGLVLDGRGLALLVGSGGLVLDGVGTWVNDVDGTYCQWDFENNVLGVGGTLGTDWASSSANAGSTAQIVGITGTYYCAELSTGGISASGAAGIQQEPVVSLAGKPTTGTSWTAEFRIYIPVLSTGASRFKVQLGWLDVASGAPAEGIWFEYSDSVNAGKWTINTKKTSGGAGNTTTNGTSAPVANTITTLKIVCTATSCEFFVDGVSQGVINTNTPTAVVALTAAIIKSVGTVAAKLEVDKVSLTIIY